MLTQLSFQGQESLRISYLRHTAGHLTASQSDKTLGTGLVAGIDALTFIEPFDNLTDFMAKADAIASQYSEVLDWRHGEPTRSGDLWHSQARSPNGLYIAFNPPMEDGPGKARIELKGSVLRRASLTTTLELLKSQIESGAKVKRLDIYIDDYLKQLKLRVIHEAINKGNYSGFREKKCFTDAGDLDRKFTQYFGSPNSDKMLRLYDKNAQSKGEINAHRLEAQLKNDVAHFHARQLIEHYNLCVSVGYIVVDVISKTIGQTVVGFIDFVNRERDENGIAKERHRDRLERLDWWQEFIDRVGEEIRYSIPRAKPTLQNKIDWLYRQVSGTFATCAKAVGLDIVFDVIDIGLEKLSNPYSKSGATHRATLKTTELEMHNPMIPKLVMQC